MGKRTILIVDDNRLARALLRDALSPGGYEVIEASDGNEAVSRFKSARPDLVMIDLMMPAKSGIQAMAEMRAIDPNSRVLVVSSLDADSLRKSALETGAVGYVVKPFHPLEIADAVERALEAGRG
jgi:two-component system, chemotaxis family, chemotaxis protein CheY